MLALVDNDTIFLLVKKVGILGMELEDLNAFSNIRDMRSSGKI